MQFFLHTFHRIRMINDAQEFECTPAEFLALEPEYPGQPDLYWTPELKLPAHAPDCAGYVAKIATYLNSLPTIWAHVTLSKTTLNINAPGDGIQFDAHLKASADPYDVDLPVSSLWNLRLTHENGLNFDAFAAAFVNGACQQTYTYQAGVPLGKWCVNEALFDRVDVAGQLYRVRLAAPVEFVIYRELS